MKKTTEKRTQNTRGRLLPLSKKTLRRLTDNQLENANGGNGSCLEVLPDM